MRFCDHESMDTSELLEGDPLLLTQTGFSLPEAAIFLRFYPRGSDKMIETAVFLRTGNLCPLDQWRNFMRPEECSQAEYDGFVRKWARARSSRRSLISTLLGFFDEIQDYCRWRKEWILSGKLYKNYDHKRTFDDEDPRKSDVLKDVKAETFLESTELLVGRLDKILDIKIKKACATGPHEVVSVVLENGWFSNECGGKKVIRGFACDFEKAFCRQQEGQWINLVVKQVALPFFGLPNAFLGSDAHKKFSVPNYDQLILHCDGTDKARTLGMHRDVYPGSSATQVSTILGCVGGLGKEILVWRGDANSVPAWWRQEGLACELFDYIYKNTDCDTLQRIVLKPGEYIFMPRGLWHWVRPIPGAAWTIMVTSSFHTCGQQFVSMPAEKEVDSKKRARVSDLTVDSELKRSSEHRPRRKCRRVY